MIDSYSLSTIYTHWKSRFSNRRHKWHNIKLLSNFNPESIRFIYVPRTCGQEETRVKRRTPASWNNPAKIVKLLQKKPHLFYCRKRNHFSFLWSSIFSFFLHITDKGSLIITSNVNRRKKKKTVFSFYYFHDCLPEL